MSKLKAKEVREWINSKQVMRGKKEGSKHYYTHTVTGFEASYAMDILYEEIERLEKENEILRDAILGMLCEKQKELEKSHEWVYSASWHCPCDSECPLPENHCSAILEYMNSYILAGDKQ